ncbi:MAG TPA: Gfo/Idh/MocA family oxidoreductase [Syntrophorhabdaceae bacterium]|nr:Gfo/Idh/MocA family oxidoreductase [Syntrophorhabdaceae bacterium]
MIKNDRILRGGIIGLGAIGSQQDEERKTDGVYSHAGAYRAVDGFELVSACEPNAERAGAFRRFWGVDTVYDDLDGFLANEELNVVSVCAPDVMHFKIIKHILDDPGQIRAVITEKPLGMTANECRDLEKLASGSGVLIEVNNHRRAEPSHCEVRRLLSDKLMGAVQAISAYYVKGLFHNGCTMVDTLRMMLGEVTRVKALPPFEVGSYGMDHSVDFLLGFQDGSKAIVQSCDKDAYHYSIFEIDMLFSGGRLTFHDNGFRIEHQPVEDYPHYPGFRSLGEPAQVQGDMARAITYIYRRVLDDLLADRTGFGEFAREAVKDMVIVEAIRESALQDGKEIEL